MRVKTGKKDLWAGIMMEGLKFHAKELPLLGFNQAV